MELFRITQDEYANDLSGNGARLFGGRWNSEGNFALYASFTRSLALLETLAHTPAKMLETKIYQLITLFVPDNISAERISLSDLSDSWDAPDTRPETKLVGDKFLLNKKNLLLAVPSVLMAEEMNYVVNPMHKDMMKIKIIHQRRIFFDRRLADNL